MAGSGFQNMIGFGSGRRKKPKDVFQKLDPNPGKIQPESQGLLVPEETS